MQFYEKGSDAVRAANPNSSINITVHGQSDVSRNEDRNEAHSNLFNPDAFQPLSSWEATSASANISRLPTQNLSLDTHQYYAYYPHGNLSESATLKAICEKSKQLKTKTSKSKLPPVLVGEWSLAQSKYLRHEQSDQVPSS